MDDWRIEYGLRCRGCGYDLRTLRVDGACPECGRPVAKNLVAVFDELETELQFGSFQPQRHPGLEKVVRYSAFDAETVELVSQSRRFAFEVGRMPGATPVIPGREAVDAVLQCLGLRDYFRVLHGGAWARELQSRGLATKGAVGELIHLMAAFGAIELGEGELMADYQAPSCPDPVPAGLLTDPGPGDAEAGVG